MELATIRFGCSGHKFAKRIGIGLTNDNATKKIRNGRSLRDILI
ncbi:hypothetical protein [Phocaeicola vulgatus]|nr:hypothetical protein [Phocaeicola vulgatus]